MPGVGDDRVAVGTGLGVPEEAAQLVGRAAVVGAGGQQGLLEPEAALDVHHDLGGAPQVELEEGLRSTIEYFRSLLAGAE